MKTMIQELLENNVWTFWSSDWSKKMTVKWNGSRKALKPFYKQLRKKLGTGFGYERSVKALCMKVKIDLVITHQ